MNKENAIKLIDIEKEYAINNGRKPGTWHLYHNHIYGVAEIAKEIASRISDLNPQKAYFMGLLHDIGKMKEEPQQRHHAIIGYEILKEAYPDIARICLTHMYPNNTAPNMAKDFFHNEKDYEFFCDFFKNNPMNEYDRLIQCCDMFADSRGFVTIEERVIDYENRHRVKMAKTHLDTYENLKKYFDNKIGVDIYSLYPALLEKNIFILPDSL